MFYYKKNIGDYYKKTGRLSMLEHGAYTLLIDSCYDRERFPTLDDALEWTWARTDDEIAAVKFVLDRFFSFDGEFYVQSRIQDELDKYHETSVTNSRIAKEREEKRRERKRIEHEACTDGSRYEHEAPPNQEPRTKNQEPNIQDKPEKFVFKKALIDLGGGESLVSDWLVVRKNKKASNTETAFNTLVSQIEKSKLDINTVLKICVDNSWSGFKYSWLNSIDMNEYNDKPKVVKPASEIKEAKELW